MSIFVDIRNDVKKMLDYGTQVRINLYTGSRSNTDYDNTTTLTQSGSSVYTSGLIFPIGNRGYSNSNEAMLLMQGKIQMSDKKIFVAGDVETTNTMKISIGSPVGSTTEHYSVLPDGVICYPPAGDISYKILYCRFLPNGGSLTGE